MADQPRERAIQPESKTNTGGDIDRVQMASRLPDGTPNQTPGFEYVGDAESAEAAAQEQLRQQAVSAADTRVRADIRSGDSGTGEDAPLSEEQKRLNETSERAARSAEGRASSEVKAHTPK